ncbi:hypothetical protein HDU76_007644 [Blyttiomyces sp. JEL0837]|nr:hypothetical protein HDU76_007644 [Blyttiomyces sp. JEL0837]
MSKQQSPSSTTNTTTNNNNNNNTTESRLSELQLLLTCIRNAEKRISNGEYITDAEHYLVMNGRSVVDEVRKIGGDSVGDVDDVGVAVVTTGLEGVSVSVHGGDHQHVHGDGCDHDQTDTKGGPTSLFDAPIPVAKKKDRITLCRLPKELLPTSVPRPPDKPSYALRREQSLDTHPLTKPQLKYITEALARLESLKVIEPYTGSGLDENGDEVNIAPVYCASPAGDGDAAMALYFDFDGVRGTIPESNKKIPGREVIDDFISGKYLKDHNIKTTMIYSHIKLAIHESAWPIVLTPTDRIKTIFVKPDNSRYQFILAPVDMPGTNNSIQDLMEDSILDGLIGVCCIVRLNEVLVFGGSGERHLVALGEVGKRLKMAGLPVWKEGCRFGEVVGERGRVEREMGFAERKALEAMVRMSF